MLSRPLQIILGLTALLTVYTIWQESAEQPADTGVAARRPQPVREIASEASAVARTVVARASAASNASAVNLFPRQTWAPPPPPPPPPAKPTPTPVPVAPPLPFQIVSTWHERGTDYVVLQAGGDQYVVCNRCDALGRVQQGEILLGTWRIDKVGRDVVAFTFMPLNQQQVLPIGGTP
ncbi:hypothetical protein [Jeongeupia sp. USM3]|uniref:hypothetical protein n=1 Tax=Jeongeupia sp. USM3 TaxID=1906741 RepID=UPI00089DFBE0|nr:hypothetical protein [Jeongeupia sp. USM3]AOY00214.1 hypothetical protein BJP62_06985 [Jeongeupia sp. USM3]